MMAIWKRAVDLEMVTGRSHHFMVIHLGIEFVEVGDDYMIACMPVDHRTKQPLGIMHGGASCVLAETVGSTAANFCVDSEYYCVGLDINTNHIRMAKGGTVWGTARPFHLGQRTQVWGIEIVDEQKKLISVTRLTMAVLKRS
jgi:1,4-dihydroxy-2-naphthoyl-CoA hydrolase